MQPAKQTVNSENITILKSENLIDKKASSRRPTACLAMDG